MSAMPGRFACRRGEVQPFVTHRPWIVQHHRCWMPAMDVRQRLGLNLRRLRRDKGMGQEKFALEFGIDRTYVSGIERGTRNPTITVVQRLADALEVPIAELFAEIE